MLENWYWDFHNFVNGQPYIYYSSDILMMSDEISVSTILIWTILRSYTSSVYMNISSTRPTSGSTSISSGYSSSRISSTSSSLGTSSIGRSTGSSYRSTGSSSIGTGSSSFGSRSVKESIGSGYSNMYKSVSSIGSKIYQSFLGRAASRRYWGHLRATTVKLFIIKPRFGYLDWSSIKLYTNSLLGTFYIFVNYYSILADCIATRGRGTWPSLSGDPWLLQLMLCA